MSTDNFKILVWKPEDDTGVSMAYQTVMGRKLAIKTPEVDRWTGRRMIGASHVTPERIEKFKELLGRRLRILDKEPKTFWRVKQ